MRKLFRQFRAVLRSERLFPADREAVRATILRAIALHPAKNEQLFQQVRLRDAAPDLLAFLRRPAFAAVALVVLLAGGGVSYAAENALPGALLYPVKVSITEPLRAALTFSAQRRAEWAAELADRRLREAERLAADGKLTVKISTQLADQLTEHAAKVQANVARLEAAGNVQAAANIGTALEASLQAHAEVMTQLELKEREDRRDDDGRKDGMEGFAPATTTDGTATTTEHGGADAGDGRRKESKLLEVIRDRSDKARHQQVNLERKVAEHAQQSRKAAENKRSAAENKIEETRKLLRKAAARYGTAATAAATVRLDAAVTVLAQGNERFNANAFAEAFVQFQLAHRGAQEAKQLIVAVKDLERKLPPLSTATPSWLITASTTPPFPREDGEKQDGQDEGEDATLPKAASTTDKTGLERRREIELRQEEERQNVEQRSKDAQEEEKVSPTRTPTPKPSTTPNIKIEAKTGFDLDL